MKRTTDHRCIPRKPVRRVLMAMLAVIYVLVGFGGEISCAEESLTTEVSYDISALPDQADQSSKNTKVVVEHCYTCAPLTIPAAIQIALPVSVSVHRSLSNDPIIVVEKRLLDPPPPKS